MRAGVLSATYLGLWAHAWLGGPLPVLLALAGVLTVVLFGGPQLANLLHALSRPHAPSPTAHDR